MRCLSTKICPIIKILDAVEIYFGNSSPIYLKDIYFASHKELFP